MPVPPSVVEADDVAGRIALIGVFSNVGAISYNGSLYMVINEYDIGTNETHAQVFKSTDAGVTWAVVDRANGPRTNAASFDVFAYYPHYPQTPGSTIYVSYTIPFPATGFGRAHLINFDLASETWGTASGDVAGFNFVIDETVVLSDATQVIVGHTTQAGVKKIYLFTYASGVFNGPVTVESTTLSLAFPSLALDASDRVYICWSIGTPNALKVAVFASNSLNSPTTVAVSFNNSGPGIYIPSLDEIWIPLRFDPTSGNSVGILRGGPTSAPVWTTENPGGVNPNIYSNYRPVFGIDTENDIFLTWINLIDSPSGELAVEYIRLQDLGTWGTLQTFWNTLSQPLTPPSPHPGDAELQVQGGFADGVLSIIVALFQDFPIIGGFCGTIYYLDTPFTPIPPDLTIACPVDGGPATVGVPYDSGPPIVDGGTEPYTFSLAGGSLPPGMTLDPDTGAVSGTTYVAGDYTYTLEVTDSSSPPLMAVVEEPCDIPVGGAIAGTPCENVTPQPTDVRFRLEKVIASLRETRHLPTRGSVK